jgi:hypothetical protein
MGYNIEVSFNINANSSVTELQDKIKMLATNCGCGYIYEEYEFENTSKHKRNHSIIVLNFDNSDIQDLIRFLKNIKRQKGLYVEVIYDEFNSRIVYASKYYTNQQMGNHASKSFKEKIKTRTYSEDDTKIINEMVKIK